MIPADFIAEWRQQVPWTQSSQVEQDLVMSRALVDLFGHAGVADDLAFRGGTALYKLYLPPARYSEDIDLVQNIAGPIGTTLDQLRSCLDPWLGQPKRTLGAGRVTLVYRFQSEDAPPLPLRLKIEINSREHFSVLGLERRELAVRSRWFTGSASIPTYQLDELLGTKLRALYQRRKGRDLFDLWYAAQHAPIDAARVVECCRRYLEHGGHRLTRTDFEANLDDKLDSREFLADLDPLLGIDSHWDVAEAAEYVRERMLARLP